MLEGILAAHPAQLTFVQDARRTIVRAGNKNQARSGLPPAVAPGTCRFFLGYVGDGLLDGCAVGGVFESPSASQMLAVTKSIDSGSGVLYIYGNYGGDVMNFDMAAEMASDEGIRVLQCVAGEDVASAPKDLKGSGAG